MSGFIKKILWTTDFSDEAQEALLYADAFAKTFKAKIVALHVVPDISPALYDAGVAIKGELVRRVDHVKKRAKAKLDALKKDKALTFKTLVEEGNAAKKIIETAVRENVDLIVIGRRGLSAVEKLFIGSVTNQVLRNSPVPLLLTKKKRGKPRFKKILVPTDFSEQEEKERDYAWRLAKGFDSEITLLHVFELHEYEFSPQALDEMFDTVMKKLKKRKKREKEDIKVREDVHRAINASIGIVDYADAHKIDMIVISTCVQSKLERFFLGSTTEKVISYSHIPVFAIPPSHCAR
ncbi:MAG: universal stress protein [Candidatus Aminicenantes bacterium]|nr:universal stress protein [Candidatus Aminicenantes bacterium]MDH5384479.1 universal stress protein [Candidatus Aminicenantes bacterium]